MVPGQEANSDCLRNFFSIFYTSTVCCVYSLELELIIIIIIRQF